MLRKATSGLLHRPSRQVYAADAQQDGAGSPTRSSSRAAAYTQVRLYSSTEKLLWENSQGTRSHFKQASFKADWLGPVHQMVPWAQRVPRAVWVLLGHRTTSSMEGKRTFQGARGYSLHISHRKRDQPESVYMSFFLQQRKIPEVQGSPPQFPTEVMLYLSCWRPWLYTVIKRGLRSRQLIQVTHRWVWASASLL